MVSVLAYTAGLIDGEGTVGLCRRSSNENRSPLLTVPSTTRELVDWLKHNHGGSISTKRTYKENHSKSYVWDLAGDKAIDLLFKVLPFMLEPEKIRRATMLVREYKSVTVRNGRYSEEMKMLKLDFERHFFDTSYARQQPVSA
jgi:hypothetical protein